MCDSALSVVNLLFTVVTAYGKPILLATLAQHFYSWFYFSVLFYVSSRYGDWWSRFLAKDKGVKKLEAMKPRFSMGLCILCSFVCSFFRALFVMLIASKVSSELTLCVCAESALAVAVVIAIHHHEDVLCQHHPVVQVVDFVFETSAALLSAVVMFYANVILN